jgi:hypothetical protein
MLRKTFRHYDIDNIIVTVSRGMLQLNQDLSIELLDAGPAPDASPAAPPGEPAGAGRKPHRLPLHARTCWYLAGGCLLVIALLLVVAFTFAGTHVARPINLTLMNHSQCELLASDEMLRSVSATAYGKNFDEVRQRLKLSCKPGSVLFSSMATGWRPTAWAGYFSPTARCTKTTRLAIAITTFTTPGSRNETRAPPFFALSALAFIAAAGFSAWRLLPDANDGVMSCSTKAIMRFENMEKRM